MAATTQQLTSAPFDAAAPRYDETFTFTNVGKAQRNAVWRCLGHAFHPGERILEIGCGTGIDASFLAQRGVRVVACDSSSEMLEVTTQRIQRQQLQRLVHPLLLRAEDIGDLHTSQSFDGAFSNFAALNCVEDLGKFVDDLATLLKPGARAVFVWFGHACIWEMVWYLCRRNPKKAFRRLTREPVIAKVGNGPSFSLGYPTIRSLVKAFRPRFRIRSIRGIGVAVPPSYAEAWAVQHPGLLRAAEKADWVLGRLPGIRALADHVLLEFERQDAGIRSAQP